jgi:hypothetical protein
MDQDFWSAVGAIGQWAGAIGTLIAVIVALRIAQYSIKPKLKINVSSSNHRRNDKGIYTEHTVKATNIGQVPIIIESAKFYVQKSKYADPYNQVIGLKSDKDNEKHPLKLYPSDTISYKFELKAVVQLF